MTTNSSQSSEAITNLIFWSIFGVEPAEGVFALMRDQASDFLNGYRADFEVRDRKMLISAQKGEFLWVLRSSGADLFCRSLLTDSGKLHHASLWLAGVARDGEARFFAGKMCDQGGLIRKISRDEAIEKMARWVFDAAGR